MFVRLKERAPVLNERTHQLVACINNRKDSQGIVDLRMCLRYWAYDIMVSLATP